MADDTKTTPADETADAAAQEGKQEEKQAEKQEKTFTQAELDAKIADRLSRAKKDMPNDEEITAFRQWQESQKTEAQKADDARKKLEADKTAAEAKASMLEREVTAIKKGVPAELSGRYVKLAESYMTDKVDFMAALDLALKDFPAPATGVPGSPGNPASYGGKQKQSRPAGTVIF